MSSDPRASAKDFEWPPAEESKENPAFRLLDPTPTPPQTRAPAPEPSESFLDEPLVVLRRATNARAQATEERERKRRPPSGRWSLWPFAARRHAAASDTRPSRWVRAALGVLILTVVLQSGYIWFLRARATPPPPPANAGDQVDAAAPVSPQSAVDSLGSSAPPETARTPDTSAATSAVDAGTGAGGHLIAAEPSTSRLVIRSEPSGARVSIDGRYRGLTPVTLTDMAPGQYRVTLERQAVKVQQTVRLDPGASVALVAPMRRTAAAPGGIALDSPIELDVFENGTLVGTSRSSRILLEPGQHRLQLVNEQLGFRDIRTVKVDDGRVTRIAVQPPRGEVLVNATPWAEVWIGGRHVGQTPIGRLLLPLGTHEIVFRHPELGERIATAVVKAGAPTRVTADMRQ